MRNELIINIIMTVMMAASSLGIVSCESDSNISINERDALPVMTAFIYPDSAITVNAYSCVSFFSANDFSPLSEAEVTLSINGNVYTQHVDSGQISVRFDDASATIGDSIFVRVVSDKGTLEAHTQMIEPKPFDLTYQLTDSLVECSVRIDDTADVSDYYQFMVFADDELVDCYYYDEIFENAISKTDNQSGYFADGDNDGRMIRVNFAFDRRLPQSARVRVRLYHHTYEYYQYITGIQTVLNDIVLPVFTRSNLYSNVAGGLGIVSAMSFVEQEVEVR